MSDTRITVGRIVHYVVEAGVHLPAIVDHVWTADLPPKGNGCCNLTVFGGHVPAARETSREYDAEAHVGTWHWPEREG